MPVIDVSPIPTSVVPDGLLAREGKGPLWRFTDEFGSFECRYPSALSSLYFPLANDAGMMSAVTPDLRGDLKIDQNHFFLKPVVTEDLPESSWRRALWVQVVGPLSKNAPRLWNVAAGAFPLHTLDIEEIMVGGPGWLKIIRDHQSLKLKVEWTVFVPSEALLAECHLINIENTGDEALTFNLVSAVPVFARSADNLRDHRQVTTLLNRIRSDAHGVIVQPVMSFDERGHTKNEWRYAVWATSALKSKPDALWLTQEEFIGEGGSLEQPLALLEGQDPPQMGSYRTDGKQALGAAQFKQLTLKPGESVEIALVLGMGENDQQLSELKTRLLDLTKLKQSFEQTRAEWRRRTSRHRIHSADANFDTWFHWISFQPMLRKIYGCSFLPDFGYGRGGRGWRDLWQDCLALLLSQPQETPKLLEDNFGGVRVDGSNATIIGKKPGEFVADRNKISRTWMDHGVWPWLTLELYLHQTGDVGFLLRKQSYFKDALIFRAKQVDAEWQISQGTRQLSQDHQAYQGSILEHVLVPHLVAFFNVGEHHICRLEDADWNDGLDMAHERGESVAFTAMYAGNLKRIADLLEQLASQKKLEHCTLFEELTQLLDRATGVALDYDQLVQKQNRLQDYFKSVRHQLTGKTINIPVAELVKDLRAKSEFLTQRVAHQEWLAHESDFGYFNGYYNNRGERTEGKNALGVFQMSLTGQVFPVMSGVASTAQIQSCVQAVRQHLWDARVGGIRLNTNYGAPQFEMGRAFSFSYGEKENGAIFSHMAVMWANALYQRHFGSEAFNAFSSLYQLAFHSAQSKILPGLPEYFNAEGRGRYHYLTGSASWSLVTIVTRMFGVRGELGDLVLDPQLVPEQFNVQNQASIETWFAGLRIHVTYHNVARKTPEDYQVNAVQCGSKPLRFQSQPTGGVQISKAELLALGQNFVELWVTLA